MSGAVLVTAVLPFPGDVTVPSALGEPPLPSVSLSLETVVVATVADGGGSALLLVAVVVLVVVEGSEGSGGGCCLDPVLDAALTAGGLELCFALPPFFLLCLLDFALLSAKRM